MKKIYSIVALLAFVLVSTTAIAGPIDKALCLSTTSSNSAATSTHVLSYTGLSAGHVLFYGETCYVSPPTPPIPEVKDCLPVTGSGILNEGKLEFFVQGTEYNNEYGFGAFTTGIMHVLLSLNTFTGTYATESVSYYEVDSVPLQLEYFETGTVTAVKCPAVSNDKMEADRQFRKMIEQLDKLGNL